MTKLKTKFKPVVIEDTAPETSSDAAFARSIRDWIGLAGNPISVAQMLSGRLYTELLKEDSVSLLGVGE